MIRGVKFSRRLAAVAAAAAAAAFASAWHREALASDIAVERRRAADLEQQFAGRMGAIEMYSDEKLRALREQVGHSRVRLGEAGTWGRLVSRLGQGWASQPGPAEDRGGYSIQFGTLRLVATATADWPKIVDAVRISEATPGVRILELEMRASGDQDRRSLDLVRILLEVQSCRPILNQGDAR